MTPQQYTKIAGEMKGVLGQDRDLLRPLVQEMLEAELDERLGAGGRPSPSGPDGGPAAPAPSSGAGRG